MYSCCTRRHKAAALSFGYSYSRRKLLTAAVLGNYAIMDARCTSETNQRELANCGGYDNFTCMVVLTRAPSLFDIRTRFESAILSPLLWALTHRGTEELVLYIFVAGVACDNKALERRAYFWQ